MRTLLTHIGITDWGQRIGAAEGASRHQKGHSELRTRSKRGRRACTPMRCARWRELAAPGHRPLGKPVTTWCCGVVDSLTAKSTRSRRRGAHGRPPAASNVQRGLRQGFFGCRVSRNEMQNSTVWGAASQGPASRNSIWGECHGRAKGQGGPRGAGQVAGARWALGERSSSSGSRGQAAAAQCARCVARRVARGEETCAYAVVVCAGSQEPSASPAAAAGSRPAASLWQCLTDCHSIRLAL